MKPSMESREHAESAAAAWIARRERDDWAAADEAELQAWINASTDNRVAWLRVSTAWQQTSRLKSLKTTRSAGHVPAPDEMQQPFFAASSEPSNPAESARPAHERSSSRNGVRTRALAATVMLSVAGAAAWYLLPRGPAYRTEVGALQVIPLSEGSRVTLNTNTELRVEVTPTERRVNLEQGEAYFEVARDPARPFIVEAGDQRVIAVGTQFSVRRERDEIRVFVTEGQVRVERNDEHGTALLGAGHIARADAGNVLVQEKSVAEVEQFLTWRTGQLAFDKTPLADAVAEFNRYNTRRIIIQDPTVAAMRVGGSFRATNVDAFVRLITSEFSIAATQHDNEIILTGMPPP
jgi:transmembrane sensor